MEISYKFLKKSSKNMLNKNTLLAITLLLAVVSAHNLAFDLRSIKYSQANDFWTVQVPCTGGSGQYSYEFQLPSGWKNEGNKIKIPASSTTQVNSQYAVRCRIKDTSSGDMLERSLVFKPLTQGNSYSLEVTDHDYFYGNSALSTNSQQTTSIHGIDVLNRLGALVKNAGSFNFVSGNMDVSNNGGAYYGSGYSGSYSGYANGNAAGYGTGYASGSATGYGSGNAAGYASGSGVSYGSGYSGSYGSQSSSSYSQSSSSSSSSGSFYSSNSSSYYTSLPSISQLQKYVAGGDIVEIIQIIQLVVDSKIRCDAKASYLSDFLGRISAAIEVKKYTLNQLKAVVTAAVIQVQKLTIQIQTIKGQQSSLKIDELKGQLQTLVNKLKAAYDAYNNFNANSSSYESDIAILEKEYNQINIKYTDVQQQLDGLRKTYQSIDIQIADYEAKIKQLKEKKVSVQNDITQGETFIKQKDVRIKEIKEKITYIKTQITNSSTQKEALKQAYIQLEKKVEAAKIAYQSANDNFTQYDQQITSITVEIQRYQKQTSELQVKQVNQCVENLESAIKEIKESIDFVQYHCYNAADIAINRDANQTKSCYQFSQTQWVGYVNTCYSNLAEQIRNKIAQSFQNQVIEISTINIYSDIWKQNYGSGFEKDIASKAQNYKTQKNFGFDSDFSCSGEFSNVETLSGVIQGINSSSVSVKGDDGKDYTLKLGSCSRFQGKGKDFVPKKGNNILWKGSKQSGSYNMHSCTCY